MRAPASAAEIARKSVRGSSLLLSGKVLSFSLNLAAQIILARYLSKSDFGAWGYALSLVAFVQTFAPLGLDRSLSRFVPIYLERKDTGRLFGIITLAMGMVLATSAAVIAVLYAFSGKLTGLLHQHPETFAILLIAVFLAPSDALDNLFSAILAAFSDTKAIFFRRSLLGPGLRFLAVAGCAAAHGSLTVLAVAYVIVSFTGLAIYGVALYRRVQLRGLTHDLQARKITIPTGEALKYALPLLSTDVVAMVSQSAVIVILGYYASLNEVAAYRAVVPLALMNRTAMMVFSMLFTPGAARLYARNDYRGVSHLYWTMAAWISVITFPVFIATFCFATPLSKVVLGAKYESSGGILAVLAAAYFVEVLSGFNGITLKVLGKLRYTVTIDFIAALSCVATTVVLTPRFGAMGAAIAVAATSVLHNVLKQVGIARVTGSFIARECLPVYAAMGSGSAVLFAMRTLPLPLLIASAATVCVAVLAISRRALRVDEAFPEMRRLPLVGRWMEAPRQC